MSECGLPASREVAACGVSHPRTESPRVGASLPVGRRYGGRIIIDRQPLSGGATLALMQIGRGPSHSECPATRVVVLSFHVQARRKAIRVP